MTYIARAENLKLNLDRTRKGQAGDRRPSLLRDSVIASAGFVWITCILIELLWHVSGIFLVNHPASLSPFPWCIVDSIRTRSVDLDCYNQTTNLLPTILSFSLLFSWWNPQLWKASRNRGTLSHQKDYYSLQAIFFAIRTAGYWLLTRQSSQSSQSTQATQSTQPIIPPRAIHGFLTIFIIIVSLLYTSLPP